MNKLTAKKRLAKLRQEIDYHRHSYHVLDQETISPAALDSLKKELVDLEEKFPDLITSDSPSQRVAGLPLAGFKKIRHSQPMTSLNDVFSLADLLAWEKRNKNILAKTGIKVDSFQYYGELKLDGLAVSLVYNQGLFAYGATRGDGLIGEDISHNLKTIKSLPLKLRPPKLTELLALKLTKGEALKIIKAVKKAKLEVRGEAVMPLSVLREINQRNKDQGLALLANSRNGAAGSLRQLDSKIAKERKLDFYAYDLFLNDLDIREIVKDRQSLDQLTHLLGFKRLSDNQVLNNLRAGLDFQVKILKKRPSLDFQIDGVVIKINQFKYWSKLGTVGKAPRYMVAYKFPAEQATTKVKGLDWPVGRSGALTPLALLSPVKIGGVLVTKASLHNFDEINRLGLKIGDTVIVERAGDVIPKVVKVLVGLRTGQEKKIIAPQICPYCGGRVERVKSMSAYRCINKNCQEIRLKKLIYFVAKPALDIEGLGKKIVLLLFKQGCLKSPADFYRLPAEDLLSLTGFKAKKANNILTAIDKKRVVDLARFILALGIDQIGEEGAKLLAARFVKETKKNNGDKDRLVKPSQLLAWGQAKPMADWQSLTDFGPVVAKNLVDFWQAETNIKLITELEQLGLRLKIKTSQTSGELLNKKLVLTGKLTGLTRQEAKDKIKQAGGQTKSSLSKEIDYLVLGAEPGSKYQQAKQWGIDILTETEFLKLIEK